MPGKIITSTTPSINILYISCSKACRKVIDRYVILCKLFFFVRIHMHYGTRFGRTAQGYGYFVVIVAGVHDVGGISRVWRRRWRSLHDRDQRSKIKSVSRERSKSRGTFYFTFIAIDFVLLVVTCLQNIVLLFYNQCIHVRPLQASVMIPLSAAQISIAFSLPMCCSPRT